MIPKRIQRRWVKGWKMPENTKSVTRPGKWGNPFLIAAKWGGHFVIDNRSGKPVGFFSTWRSQQRAVKCAVDSFRELVLAHQNGDTGLVHYRYLKENLGDFNLACSCPLCDKHKDGRPWNEPCDDCPPCHADVLLELANS